MNNRDLLPKENAGSVSGATSVDVRVPSPGRHEFKYLIRDDQSSAIRSFLHAHLELDKYSQSRPNDSYTVRSIYYDSPSFKCYHEKADGSETRRKYRVRTYNTGYPAAVFLECKQRSGGTYTKQRLRLEPDVLAVPDEWIDAASMLESQVLGELQWKIVRWGYQPAVLIAYDREAYVAPGQFDTVRVTFDRNLRARMFPSFHHMCSEQDLTPLLYGWTILEIKFTDVIPRFMQSLVTSRALQRQACSKYGLSVASLFDENPTIIKGWTHAYAD